VGVGVGRVFVHACAHVHMCVHTWNVHRHPYPPPATPADGGPAQHGTACLTSMAASPRSQPSYAHMSWLPHIACSGRACSCAARHGLPYEHDSLPTLTWAGCRTLLAVGGPALAQQGAAAARVRGPGAPHARALHHQRAHQVGAPHGQCLIA